MAPLGLEAVADADCEVDEEGLEGCGPDGVGDAYRILTRSGW
jgi:hypothetical protein